jgi:(S)-2-hydroxyglutarate dehydrogenase
MATYDYIIIGGGIVGLATALKIQEKHPASRLLVVEKEGQLAKHQTGNNSGVIHSGLYYKPGSLKATNCIKGYHMLVDFATKHEIPFELCGKIVVATEERELPLLQNLYDRGNQNGLKNLKFLGPEEIHEHEPHIAGIRGIYVPQTGIIDYSKVAEKYGELLQINGAEIHLSERVVDLRESTSGMTVVTDKGTYETKLLINCAGLYSDKIARMAGSDPGVKIVPFRGEYYKLSPAKEHLVKHLVYPVPDPNFPFLGVHFTRMMKGGVEAGPNAVLAFRREGYSKSQIHLGELAESLAWPGFQKVAWKYWRTGMGEMYRSFSKAAFTKALQKLLPELSETDLVPGGAGVRAQACDKQGGLIDDFLIQETQHAIHVCNAPSPAATSSLSIGDTISDMAMKRK